MKSIIRKKIKTLRKPISSKSKLMVLAEKRHIQAHLAITELRLRIKTPHQKTQSNRTVALNILHDYWLKGVFPTNTYRTNKRLPIFIDDNGVYCAVGHVMAQTGHSTLAKHINKADRFVLVEQLQNKQVENWLQAHGLSMQEAALIQPGYGPNVVIENVPNNFQEKLVSIATLLACMVLLAIVVIALKVVARKSPIDRKKRNYTIGLSFAAIAIIASFILYLPTPKQAISALTVKATGGEVIECYDLMPTKVQQEICDDFMNGGAEGWREAR